MSHNIRKPFGAAALGALFVGSLAAAPLAAAAENPFGMQGLESGYMVADASDKGAEGKCGASDKGTEGKCGEGRCGSK